LTEKEVQRYVCEEFKTLLSNPNFIAQLPWHLSPAGSEQDRTSIIIERIKRMARNLKPEAELINGVMVKSRY